MHRRPMADHRKPECVEELRKPNWDTKSRTEEITKN